MTITPDKVTQLITVRQSDTQRIIYDQLLFGGSPINLTGQTVVLVAYDTGTETVTRRTATVTSAISGSVQYQFVTADLASTGSKLLEWELTDGSGNQLTVPSTGYIKLNIVPDLR